MAKTGTFVDPKTREQIRTPGYYDEIYSADGTERLDHRLERIDSDLTNLIVVDAVVSNSVSIASNSASNLEANVAKSGYTPLGIVGYTVNSTSQVPIELRVSGSKAICLCRNISSSSITAHVNFRVLYMKNL